MNLETSLHREVIPTRQREVLLIEDDPHWQMIISRTLKAIDKGIILRCVRTAKHAERLIYNDPRYDLIIADHFLDGSTTGLDLWKKCRSSLCRIPFMMVSGLKESDFLELVNEESDYPLFLQKPFEVNSLTAMLNWHLKTPVNVLLDQERKLMLLLKRCL